MKFINTLNEETENSRLCLKIVVSKSTKIIFHPSDSSQYSLHFLHLESIISPFKMQV